MHGEGAKSIGYFGVVPGRRGFVGAGLPADFTDRFDRWFTLASQQPAQDPAPEASAARPLDVTWRFVARAGLFGPFAAAGAWQLSHDAGGLRYPLVVASLGPAEVTDQVWFDRVAAIVSQGADGNLALPEIEVRLSRLPAPAPPQNPPQNPPQSPPESAIVLWRDDWEVHELRFASASSFAAFGLPGGG